MATDLAEKAKEAFFDDDFQLAVDLYSQAIDLNPKNADYFADRAQANIKLSNFTEAVADAKNAIELDPSMVKAYLRKGTACFKLEEYHTARIALEKGAALAPNDSRLTKLITECDRCIAEENSELIGSKVPPAAHVSAGSQLSDEKVENLEKAEQGQNESHQLKDMEPIKPKYRHSYYQKPDEVVVTIFAKGVAAKNVSIHFGEQILSVTIDVPGENKYHFQPRLFGKIVPDKCRFEVLSTKVEIHLVKAEAVNWTSLEYTKEVAVKHVNVLGPGLQRPSYPSSKPRITDWDKLEAQVKEEEKEEKLDGDAALNKFFGDIYNTADEDTKRAMMKSFVESNGTVMSTNWTDVGSKMVEGSPPHGMELKKWEY